MFAVLWNTVWVLYVSLKHIAKKAEIETNRNMKDKKTFPYKKMTEKINSLLERQGKK